MAANKQPRRKPAMTPEERENQLISAAMDMVEEQIRDRTASAQVLNHYLKLGSTRERLEQERLRNENNVLEAKVEQLASAKRVEELYISALEAMRNYSGNQNNVIEIEEGDDY